MYIIILVSNNNNNRDFLHANILEYQAQWRYKTNGLSNLIIVNNAQVSFTVWKYYDNTSRNMFRIFSLVIPLLYI